MSEVLQSNVFFFITGVAVIVLTALLCVALINLIGILRSARKVVKAVERGTQALSDDVRSVRNHVATVGIVRAIISFVRGGESEEEGEEEKPKAKSRRKHR